MEVSALRHHGVAGFHGPTSLLRLQSDERLVVLTRRGNEHAYAALVSRYESRLLAFCRHMLGSREDAEDVLQEVFAAAFNAMLADERPINVRPWLYRIARNRALNHLRRQQAIGVDSMDVHLAEHGTTTADKVHRREDFRQVMADVGELPESQRTALLLREIDALSYEHIAEAMETTVPSVKSLLVRARVSLAEAAEARKLTCEQVRLELAEVAEGLTKTTAPVRRHLRTCDRCRSFRVQLRQTNRALALLLPVTPLLVVKKLVLAHLGGASAGGAGVAAGGGAGGAMTGGLSAGLGAVATKAAAGLAAAALVTAGAVEVDHAASPVRRHTGATVERTAQPAVAPAEPSTPPVVAQSAPEPATGAAAPAHTARAAAAQRDPAPDATTTPAKTTTTPKPAATTPATTTPLTTQEDGSTVVLPPQGASGGTTTTTTTPSSGQPAPTTTSGDSSASSPPPSGDGSSPPPNDPPPSGSGGPPPSGQPGTATTPIVPVVPVPVTPVVPAPGQ